MKNKNSTRRSFGRRALAFGIAMFAMVTLTAVGFAAWLISTNAHVEAGGGIVTQDVHVASIKIEIENVSKGSDGKDYLVKSKTDTTKYDIVFAPPKDSADGAYLRYYNEGDYTDDKPENLVFDAYGTIANYDKVGRLMFSVRVSPSVVVAAGLTKTGDTWNYDSAKAYIELPTYAMDENGKELPKVVNGNWDNSTMTAPVTFKNISDADATLSATLTEHEGSSIVLTKPGASEGMTAKFRCTKLGFKWGKRYDNVNPAITANKNTPDWGSLTTVVGIERDKNYAHNQLAYELIKLQFIVNGQKLDAKFVQDNVSALYSKLGTGVTDANLDEKINNLIKNEAETGTTDLLLALQAAFNTKTDKTGTIYKFVIDAEVR